MLDRPENPQSSIQWKASYEFNAAAYVEFGEIGLFLIAILLKKVQRSANKSTRSKL